MTAYQNWQWKNNLRSFSGLISFFSLNGRVSKGLGTTKSTHFIGKHFNIDGVLSFPYVTSICALSVLATCFAFFLANTKSLMTNVTMYKFFMQAVAPYVQFLFLSSFPLKRVSTAKRIYLVTTSSSWTSDEGCIQNAVLTLKKATKPDPNRAPLVPDSVSVSVWFLRIIHKFWLCYLLSAK